MHTTMYVMTLALYTLIPQTVHQSSSPPDRRATRGDTAAAGYGDLNYFHIKECPNCIIVSFELLLRLFVNRSWGCCLLVYLSRTANSLRVVQPATTAPPPRRQRLSTWTCAAPCTAPGGEGGGTRRGWQRPPPPCQGRGRWRFRASRRAAGSSAPRARPSQ